MKLTDYLAEFLVKKGVKNVYGVSGGAACHIFDSLCSQESLKVIFNHHEQASALAATASSKIHRIPNVCVVTTGPGGTNATTGVLAAWQDSTPVIFISGQVRSNQLSVDFPGVRQRAIQEFNITEMVSSITKFAVTVKDPNAFSELLEKSWQVAIEGRPGPVWIDIPLDLQWQDIPVNISSTVRCTDNDFPQESLALLRQRLLQAKRPVFLLGGGAVYDSKSLVSIAEKLGVPCVCTWQAANLFSEQSKHNYFGRVGIYGHRGANIIVHEADLLVVFGSSLGACITGNIAEDFAPGAQIFSINVDNSELVHCIKSEINPINARIIDVLSDVSEWTVPSKFDDWMDRCHGLNHLNDIDYRNLPLAINGYIQPYSFIRYLVSKSGSKDVFVADGGGTNLFMSFQAIQSTEQRQLICSTGICAMGTGLPEAIGVASSVDTNNVTTYCFIGDGSLQFNVQELQTIKHHNLNIKIVVFNNDGYLAIRHTQRDYFDRRYLGSDRETLTLPDTSSVADTYGIPFVSIKKEGDIELVSSSQMLKRAEPCIIEISTDPEGNVFPVQGKRFNADGTSQPLPLNCMHPELEEQ